MRVHIAIALAGISVSFVSCAGPVRETATVNGVRQFTVHPDLIQAEAAALPWQQPVASKVEQITDCTAKTTRTASDMRPWSEHRKLFVILDETGAAQYVIAYRTDWAAFDEL
jgi:hypothetical protein